METLQRVKLDGFQMAIHELEVEQDHLRRAMRYLQELVGIGSTRPIDISGRS
jgi:hypothetical protein